MAMAPVTHALRPSSDRECFDLYAHRLDSGALRRGDRTWACGQWHPAGRLDQQGRRPTRTPPSRQPTSKPSRKSGPKTQADLHILEGIAAETGTGTPGKGFAFSPEEIATQISQCQKLIKDSYSDQEEIANIIRTTPPAPDEAGSVHQANAVVKLGHDLMARNHSQIAYLESWVAKLKKAQQDYLETEHLTQAQWNRLTLGLDI